ncbi:hypothetical protein GW17_00045854 [Ensete ventricosum]|nr:hypothetical protein GW17_00045854 [Ensete ventricosum]
MEVIITFTVPVLGSRRQRVGSFEESLLSDLEKDLCPSGVEQNIGQSGNDLLTSLHPPPWKPKGWAPRGLSQGALLIFTFLYHQSLSCDVLVGPLQHCWYSHGGSLHISGWPSSPHSSFVLKILRTSSILWFTKRSCSFRELVESEESVSVPLEVGCVAGGTSSLGLTGIERSCDIGDPPSSAKCCGCSTASRESAQRDSSHKYKRNPTQAVRSRRVLMLGSGCHFDAGSSTDLAELSCKIRPFLG